VESLIRLRNTLEDRYISGSFQDLPRDPETEDEKSLWDESDGYMAKQPISKGSDQAFMVYYRSPQNKHGLPPFNNNPIGMDSYVGLPFYKIEDEVNLIPINVRPNCATLGFAYLDLPDVDLSKLFPADVAADGVLFRMGYAGALPVGHEPCSRIFRSEVESGHMTIGLRALYMRTRSYSSEERDSTPNKARKMIG
jgi:hypothetical protein